MLKRLSPEELNAALMNETRLQATMGLDLFYIMVMFKHIYEGKTPTPAQKALLLKDVNAAMAVQALEDVVAYGLCTGRFNGSAGAECAARYRALTFGDNAAKSIGQIRAERQDAKGDVPVPAVFNRLKPN